MAIAIALLGDRRDVLRRLPRQRGGDPDPVACRTSSGSPSTCRPTARSCCSSARACRTSAATLWLDGLIAALGVSSVSAAVIFDTVLHHTHGNFGVVATGLAYPVGDLVLLGGLVSVGVASGRAPAHALVGPDRGRARGLLRRRLDLPRRRPRPTPTWRTRCSTPPGRSRCCCRALGVGPPAERPLSRDALAGLDRGSDRGDACSRSAC